MDASQHVARLFLRDLGRQADPAGQAFWESRAKEVSPAQLNVEFREAAKKENPQAGQPRGSGMATDPYSTIALPGEEGYRPDKSTNFFQQLAPFIVPIIGAVAPQLLPAIGSALGASGAAAAAVGAGVVNAGVTAATGGSASDILKAGLAAGAGTYAGSAAGQAVKSAQQAGTLSGTVGGSATLPAVAAGAAGAGTGTLIQTGDLGQAGLAAIGSGIGQGIGGAALDVLPDDANLTLKSGLASATGGAAEAAVTGQDVGASALVSGLAGAGQDYITEQKLKAEQAKQQISGDILKAFTNPANKVDVAFAGPITADEINQLARNASRELIDTWRARAAADPTFAKELAKPENLTAIRNAGLVELATAVTSLTSVAAGGAGATALATGLLAVPAAEAVRRATQENSMLGAMSGDTAFASALIDQALSTPNNTLTTTDTTSRLPEVVVEAPQFEDVPQTADVLRVSKILQISPEQAAILSQRNSTLFNYFTGKEGAPTPPEIDTLPLRERAAIESANRSGQPISSLQDFNVVITGQTPPTTPGVQTAIPTNEQQILELTGITPKIRTNLSNAPSGQQDQIQSLYDQFLNREADQAGRQFWEQRATQVSADQLQREFQEAARQEQASSQTQSDTKTQTDTRTQTGTQTNPRTQSDTKTETGTNTQTDTPTTSGSTTGGSSGGPTVGGVTPTITDQDREIINLTGIDGGGTDVTGPSEPIDTDVDDVETPQVEGMESITGKPSIRKKKKKRRGTVETKMVPKVIGAPLNMMPGSSALAQALSVGDPGGSFLDKKGRRRQPVWNVESLKLTDELGGSGYD